MIALRTLSRSCLTLPFDPAATIAFALPATPVEREHGFSDSTHPRKPKLELVRDDSIDRPYVSLSIDTPFAMSELVERFPDPIGFARAGNETYFRTIRVAHPFPDFDIVLDLNTRETAALEISHLLVEAGHRIPHEGAPSTD